MQINVDLVLSARKQKSWSQEELAIAAGLNLRTIQRVESEGSASLQSKKALASALDLDVHDLDYQEIQMRQEWEYKVVETKDRAALQSELAGFGGVGIGFCDRDVQHADDQSGLYAVPQTHGVMTSNGLSGEWRSEELGSRGQHAHACVQETHEQVALSSGHDGCVDAAARPEAWSWLDFAAV